MESQCEYFMYFPAVPFAARELLTGEPGRYRALPRRNHLYLGETVRFLLVLRCRPGSGPGPGPAWAELASSLAALASVSPGGAGPGGAFDPTKTPREGARPALPWRRRGGTAVSHSGRCREVRRGAVEGDGLP